MWPAFPTPDYYGGSAPTRRYRSAVDLPSTTLAAQREGQPRIGSHVHYVPLDEGDAQLFSCSLAPRYATDLPGGPPHRHK